MGGSVDQKTTAANFLLVCDEVHAQWIDRRIVSVKNRLELNLYVAQRFIELIISSEWTSDYCEMRHLCNARHIFMQEELFYIYQCILLLGR